MVQMKDECLSCPLMLCNTAHALCAASPEKKLRMHQDEVRPKRYLSIATLRKRRRSDYFAARYQRTKQQA